MNDQDTIQESYHVKETIEILFDQIETGQEFVIAVNLPFYDRQLADMFIAQILSMQEYTHAYHMWKIILDHKRTWVHLKAHFQESYMD